MYKFFLLIHGLVNGNEVETFQETENRAIAKEFRMHETSIISDKADSVANVSEDLTNSNVSSNSNASGKSSSYINNKIIGKPREITC